MHDVWFIASSCVDSFLLVQAVLLSQQMVCLSRLCLFHLVRRESDLWDSITICHNWYWIWKRTSQTQNSGKLRLDSVFATKIINQNFMLFCAVRRYWVVWSVILSFSPRVLWNYLHTFYQLPCLILSRLWRKHEEQDLKCIHGSQYLLEHIIFSLISLFLRNESRIVRSAFCLYICVPVYPLMKFWMPQPVFMKLGMHIMEPELISTAYFIINPSPQSVCLYMYPIIVARKRLGKSLPRQ
jgi:hypothetical protein